MYSISPLWAFVLLTRLQLLGAFRYIAILTRSRCSCFVLRGLAFLSPCACDSALSPGVPVYLARFVVDAFAFPRNDSQDLILTPVGFFCIVCMAIKRIRHQPIGGGVLCSHADGYGLLSLVSVDGPRECSCFA